MICFILSSWWAIQNYYTWQDVSVLSTSNHSEKRTPLNILFFQLWQLSRDVSISSLFSHLSSAIIVSPLLFQVSGGCSCSLKNAAEPLFSSFISNRVHWPVGITMPLRERLEKNKCGHGNVPSIWDITLVKSNPQCVSCALLRESAHFCFILPSDGLWWA